MSIGDSEVETRRAADRERKRKSRFLGLQAAIGGGGSGSPLEGEIVTFDPTTIDGLKDLLRFTGRKLMAESGQTDAYTFTKSACALATVGLKMIEQNDLVERLTALEEAIQKQEGERK